MSLHEEVESIQTNSKNTNFTPQVKLNFLTDFRLEALLSAFCEHDVQSFTVARWTDFLHYNEYKEKMSVKY